MWIVNQLGTATNGEDIEIRVELNREHYYGDKPKFDIFMVTIADGIIRREMLKDWLNLDDAVDLVNRLVDKFNEREKINGVGITHENFGDDPPRLNEAEEKDRVKHDPKI